MPTYDYVCRGCGHEFELFQSMKDAPKRKCPRCAKNALERLIGTGGAIIFKGGGFYETDYRSEAYQKAAKAEGSGAAGDATKTDATKNEATKNEPRAESKPDAPAGSDAARNGTSKARPEPKPSETKAGAKSAEPKPAGSKGKGSKPAKSA